MQAFNMQGSYINWSHAEEKTYNLFLYWSRAYRGRDQRESLGEYTGQNDPDSDPDTDGNTEKADRQPVD